MIVGFYIEAAEAFMDDGGSTSFAEDDDTDYNFNVDNVDTGDGGYW